MDTPTARRNYPRIIAAVLLVLGLALVAMMVTTEGELGALPLGLVLAGVVGLWLSRRRRRDAKAE